MSRTLPVLALLTLVGCGKKEAAQGTTPSGGTAPSGALSIEVTEPEAAAFLPVGPVTVEGTQTGLSDLTLNGEPMDAADGTFSVGTEVIRGVNHFEARGEKGGTFRMVRRGVLAGSFADASGPIDEAMGIRLNQGGLDAIGGLVGGLVDPAAISGSLAGAGPVYESVLVDLYVSSLWFSPLELDFSPSPGELAVDVVLPDVDITLLVDTALGDFDAFVTADEARIAGVITLGTDGQGHLSAGFTDAWVELDGLDLDTSLLPGDLTFGVEGLLQGTVEDLLQEQVAGALPGLLEAQLSTLELAFDLDLLGTAVSIASAFRGASVDTDGVQIVADLDVDVASNGTKIAPGFLSAGEIGRPVADRSSDLGIALSDDLVNRLLHEVWTGGLIDLQLTTEDGSLPSSYLEDFGTDEGTLQLDAKLPPVLVQNGDQAELQIGELEMHLSTPTNSEFTYIDLALSGKIPVDLEVIGGELKVSLGTPDIDFIVRDTDWGVDDDWLTELLEEKLPIADLIVVLGNFSFELPEIAGISLGSAKIDRDDSGLFTTIGADL